MIDILLADTAWHQWQLVLACARCHQQGIRWNYLLRNLPWAQESIEDMQRRTQVFSLSYSWLGELCYPFALPIPRFKEVVNFLLSVNLSCSGWATGEVPDFVWSSFPLLVHYSPWEPRLGQFFLLNDSHWEGHLSATFRSCSGWKFSKMCIPETELYF